MPPPRSYYETLNVSPDAESVVVEAAYRALMKKYHPDQGGGAGGEGAPSAAEINQAYAVLREPGRRADYDRREYVRQQKIQLASYPSMPPPRRSNFFGWGGWLVALMLAAMIGLMASRGNVAPLSAAEEARAALLAMPDLRSQPIPIEEAELPETERAAIRADAFVGPAIARPAPTTARRSAAPATAAARQASSRAPRKASRRRAASFRKGRESDFLERQGYIY